MGYDYIIDDVFTHGGNAFYGGLAIFLIIFVIIFAVIALALTALSIIGIWKTLEKAGKPGWGALIPYYNTFLLCQISGVNPMWVLITVIIGALGIVIPSIFSIISLLGIVRFGLGSIISILSFASTLYLNIILGISVARSFGKSDSFGIGLILLPPVFYFLLGTGNDKYRGPKPMKDKVFEFLNQYFDLNGFTFTNTTEGKGEFIKKCPYCGSKIQEKSKFCSTCGAKL